MQIMCAWHSLACVPVCAHMCRLVSCLADSYSFVWLSLTLSPSWFSCYGDESGEKWRAMERNENMCLESPSSLIENHCANTSLHLQVIASVPEENDRFHLTFFFNSVVLTCETPKYTIHQDVLKAWRRQTCILMLCLQHLHARGF